MKKIKRQFRYETVFWFFVIVIWLPIADKFGHLQQHWW